MAADSEEETRNAFALLIDLAEESDSPDTPDGEWVPYEFLKRTSQKADRMLPAGDVARTKLWLLRQANSITFSLPFFACHFFSHTGCSTPRAVSTGRRRSSPPPESTTVRS